MFTFLSYGSISGTVCTASTVLNYFLNLCYVPGMFLLFPASLCGADPCCMSQVDEYSFLFLNVSSGDAHASKDQFFFFCLQPLMNCGVA